MRLLYWNIFIFCCVVRVGAQFSFDCNQQCGSLIYRFRRYQTQAFINKIYNSCMGRCSDNFNRRLYPTTTPEALVDRNLFITRPKPSVEQPRTDYTVCGRHKSITSRIVGGQRAHECEFPWMVALVYNMPDEKTKICGGTILDSRHILTAAHCVRKSDFNVLDTSDVTVKVGSSSLFSVKPYRVKHINAHPSYTLATKNFDVAVLTLVTDLTFGLCVSPICLPNVEDTAQGVCTSMGWGATKAVEIFDTSVTHPYNLQKVDLPIVSNQQCSMSYPYINNLKMCAGDFYNGKIDSCIGDSGGPLVCSQRTGNTKRYIQYGIVSYGASCGKAKSPGVYTKVSNRQILSFIHNALKYK